ncbi:MAG: flagellar protein FlaG [Methylotenera sp.]
MFSSPLDAYGSVNRPAGSQHIAASQIALVSSTGHKTVDMSESKPSTQIDKGALAGAVKKLNDYVAPALQTVEFSLDHDSKRMIVKVVDTATHKVLRQIPNEEVIAMSKTLDKLQGLVIRQTA